LPGGRHPLTEAEDNAPRQCPSRGRREHLPSNAPARRSGLRQQARRATTRAAPISEISRRPRTRSRRHAWHGRRETHRRLCPNAECHGDGHGPCIDPAFPGRSAVSEDAAGRRSRSRRAPGDRFVDADAGRLPAKPAKDRLRSQRAGVHRRPRSKVEQAALRPGLSAIRRSNFVAPKCHRAIFDHLPREVRPAPGVPRI
jgi:hypothetical protein